MGEKHIHILINKVLSGTATDAEKNMVEQWYLDESNKEAIWETTSPNEEAALESQMLHHLQKHIRSKRNKVLSMPARLGIAASIAFLVCLGVALLYLKKPSGSGAAETVAGVTQNRYILLPDSSVVLLHPGSKIEYTFTAKIRSLNLVGEAFFDIKHHQHQPFVIHTGTVTTTVLGTAFNIKAYKGQKVVVTVTRGKVSVSDAAKQVRAVLTRYQVAEVNEQTKAVAQRQVSDQTSIDWIKADMQFDELPFGELADRLSKRYGVNFAFKNPKVEKCPVTGRFTGTESLQDALNIISPITSTNYKVEGSTVIIDGTGCSQ
ncbi:DUF4974 domain-containing protein [Mucilaginibacter sp. RS28]|uniref:DUF4974 domain-containing protein n=1 Tax=Mucilaginibacter straminoryzae TaxID=2932774 RepID=A0A9X2BC24_9SPHI|nr:FecR domain-containing protein [Mucilaginibacter straminoryzae]MCJ8208863.1 DUF4974 domain-containing protein [Mucilaginibacter straminoryzae]